jgi:hypothetical protein
LTFQKLGVDENWELLMALKLGGFKQQEASGRIEYTVRNLLKYTLDVSPEDTRERETSPQARPGHQPVVTHCIAVAETNGL